MDQTKPVLDPVQGSTEYAENAFCFLLESGFRLKSREVGGGQSYRAGWRLTYSSLGVSVEVEYEDQEFRVWFRRTGVAADFRTIDRELYGSRSGFQGDMFPPQKLRAAIDLVAAQVHDGFKPILKGQEPVWQQIAKIVNAPTTPRRLP